MIMRLHLIFVLVCLLDTTEVTAQPQGMSSEGDDELTELELLGSTAASPPTPPQPPSTFIWVTAISQALLTVWCEYHYCT